MVLINSDVKTHCMLNWQFIPCYDIVICVIVNLAFSYVFLVYYKVNWLIMCKSSNKNICVRYLHLHVFIKAAN